MSGSSVGTREERSEFARVKELVGYLYKSVKTILLYPPANPLPAEFKARLHAMLSDFLEEFGPLSLQVRGDEFLYDGKTVHEERGGEDNFIATLTRDGVQRLTFLPGLTAEELDRFLGIVKKIINERDEDDDLVTLLWEASFERIRHEAITELESVDYEAIERRLFSRNEQMPADTGRINYGAIVLEEGADQAFAGAALDGPTTRPIEAVDVGRIIGDLADLSDDLSQVDVYLREAMQFDPAGSTVGILFEILIGENEIPEYRESCDLLDNLYDRFVERADFRSAERICRGVAELERAEREHSPARAKRLTESIRRTSDKMRMERLAAALNANAGCDIESCRALLAGFPVEILPHLVNALGVLEHFPARKMMCDILAERGTDRVDMIGNGIFDKRWYVVRNVAIVLGNIGGPRACTYLEKAIDHEDERVRREVIEALVRMDPRDTSRTLRLALGDPKVDLRLLALRALAHRHDEETGDIINARVLEPSFRHLEPTEQKDWLAGLARIRGDASLPTFRRLISRWILFDRSARLRLRTLATLALGESEGVLTEAYLERLSRHRNPRVQEAAARALHRYHSEHTGV